MKRSDRKLTVSYTHHLTQSECVEIPAIRLKGKWLERLGFTYGKKISIETCDKKLVITLLDEPITQATLKKP